MKRKCTFLSSLFLSLMVCVSCTQINAQTKKLSLTDQVIRGVDISSAFEVTISQGTKSSVDVEISEPYAQYLEMRIDEDGVLKVDFNKPAVFTRVSNPVMKLIIVCSTLEEVELSGAVTAVMTTPLRTNSLDFDLSGASSFKSKFNVEVAGKMEAECSGSSGIKVSNISASRAEIDCSGASEFTADLVTGGELSVDASGASNIKLSGSSSSINVESSGASNVDCSKLKTGNVWCEISGASHLSVLASGQVQGRASGASSVVCMGGGRVNIDKSSGASVSSK